MASEADLKRKILRLLKEDEEFRLAVAGLIGLDTLLTELRKLREDHNKLREDFNKFVKIEERRWEEAYRRFEAIEEEIRKLREDLNKLREDHNKLREDFNKAYVDLSKRAEALERAYLDLSRRLDALGARWGVISEEAFREGMRGVLEKVLGVAKVGRWVYYDSSGAIYGKPSVIEVDVVVKDGEHVLVEVKSSISRGDIYEFWRIAELYRKVTGAAPRLVVVSPYVDSKARELAESLGIEVYTQTS